MTPHRYTDSLTFRSGASDPDHEPRNWSSDMLAYSTRAEIDPAMWSAGSEASLRNWDCDPFHSTNGSQEVEETYAPKPMTMIAHLQFTSDHDQKS